MGKPLQVQVSEASQNIRGLSSVEYLERQIYRTVPVPASIATHDEGKGEFSIPASASVATRGVGKAEFGIPVSDTLAASPVAESKDEDPGDAC